MDTLSAITSREPQPPSDPPQLTGELFRRWLGYLDASPKTLETYTRALRQFFRYLDAQGVTRPTRETVLAYREHLRQGRKPATVQNYLAAVRLFFQWTEQEGLYPDVARHVKGPKIDRLHKKDYLTAPQVQKLLGSIDRSTLGGLRDYAMIALMVTTGLRTVSVARAELGDLRPAGEWAALYYQGKGREEKAEYVKLATPVEEAIWAYLSARGEGDPGAPLFGSLANRNPGGAMTTRSVSRAVKDRLLGAGLCSDRLTAHSLRHTAATLNLLGGGTVEETQQLLGHSSVDTTLIYSHALERAGNHSEQRIANAIFGQ